MEVGDGKEENIQMQKERMSKIDLHRCIGGNILSFSFKKTISIRRARGNIFHTLFSLFPDVLVH